MENKYAEVDPNSLKTWDMNPRINDHAVAAVARSIEEFGFQNPVIVQRGSNVILAGHTRVKAALQLGLKTIPVKYADLEGRRAEQFAIADNQTASIADWNEDKLAEILSGFEAPDLESLGFDDQFLEDLLASFESEEESSEELPPAPEPVETKQTFHLMKGNCLEQLKLLEDNSVDAVVTDPPYEIAFMGKSWDDSGIAYSAELWNEVFRVLKHGGHVVSFCATRTIHGMTTAIEKAGFEIRDMIIWCFESGFPKNLSVDQAIDKKLGVFDKRKVIRTNDQNGAKFKRIQEEIDNGGINDPNRTEFHVTAPYSTEAQKYKGFGTALKPAYEPAVLARKPLIGSVAENVLEHGVGGINIDACRFAYGDPIWFGSGEKPKDGIVKGGVGFYSAESKRLHGFRPNAVDRYDELHVTAHEKGRFPANIVRFKKAQRSEREAGLEHLAPKTPAAVQHQQDTKENWEKAIQDPRAGTGRTAESVKNHHPTVKPLDLMRWLIRLVVPEGGLVLDPFLGSGTTAAAAILENKSVIGCEMTEEYFEIIEGRVAWAKREFSKTESGEE